MTPSWFGSLAPWLMLAGAWMGLTALVALALGLIARAEVWRGRK